MISNPVNTYIKEANFDCPFQFFYPTKQFKLVVQLFLFEYDNDNNICLYAHDLSMDYCVIFEIILMACSTYDSNYMHQSQVSCVFRDDTNHTSFI